MTIILLIDDDEALAAPLQTYFAQFNMQLLSATHPEKGLNMLKQQAPELVILDVMLPEIDGFEVCRQIRTFSDIPVLMLTARGDVMDRIIGLELGADDYLPKPFEPRELVARIQNILRRSNHHSSHIKKLSFGVLEIDLEIQSVSLSRNVLNLTSTEYRLLSLLAQSPGKPFSRDEIINALKGIDAELYTRAVDIAISRLRKKLEPIDCIKTVWGSGYSFIAPATPTDLKR
jgi:OmpR family response regulator RpaB